MSAGIQKTGWNWSVLATSGTRPIQTVRWRSVREGLIEIFEMPMRNIGLWTGRSSAKPVSQGVISAYEKGRREPSVSALSGLPAAAGHRLVAETEPEMLRVGRSHTA